MRQGLGHVGPKRLHSLERRIPGVAGRSLRWREECAQWLPGNGVELARSAASRMLVVSLRCTSCVGDERFFRRKDVRNKEPDLSFAEVQNRYATLIENLGQSRLPSGKSISETFTVEDIPFWEIFSAELAWRHLTTAVAAATPLANAKLLLKPFALRLKERVQDAILRHQDTSGCSSWPDSPTFLALGLTSRMYRDVLEPVMEYLTSDGACRAVVLTDKPYPGSDQARGRGISYQTLWQHWDGEVRQQTQQLRESMRQVESEFTGSKALRHLLSTVDPHMSAALDKVFYLLLRCYLPLILPQAAIAKHILTRHRPSLLLSPDTSDARTRIYTLLSKRMNIPCMDIQFGLAGDEAVEWRFFAADCVAVWGAASREALLRQKVPAEKILLTGSPRHDALLHPSHEAAGVLRARLGLTSQSPVILLASTYTDGTHTEYSSPEILRTMKSAIFEAAEKIPEITLLVKPHPHEDVKETRALVGAAKNVIFADKTSDIRDLLAVCDAFVSFGSTATIDALIANKLSICPIFPGWPFSEEFKRSGAVLVPETFDQIMAIFLKIAKREQPREIDILKSARQSYLTRIAYKADGLATTRIGEQARIMAGIKNTK